MSLIELVREASARSQVGEDEEPVELRLLPGLDPDEIAAFERSLPCPLPADVRELVAYCAGFEGIIDRVDFPGRLMFEYEAAFPHGLPIAADGYGNFWVVDLHKDSDSFGPIYFACHDPPVILYQGPTLVHFLSELFKICAPPYTSLVDDVHEDRLYEVWRKNPGVRSYDECITSHDADLVTFAQELGPAFQVVDLRDAKIGMGFSWGRYGPNTVVRRHGASPIFAYQVQERRGFLRRLFGG